MGASILLYVSGRDVTQQFLWGKWYLKALKWDHETGELFQRMKTRCLQFKDLIILPITVSSTLNTPLQSDFSERINKSGMTTGSKATAARGRMMLSCGAWHTEHNGQGT